MSSGIETINLHLLHGDPNRLRVAEISGWVGQAVAAPRVDVRDLIARSEVQRTGVYFLLGENPTNGKQEAYIGEADNVGKRLGQHRALEFWNQAVSFTSLSDSFTKAHARLLESRLISEATEVGRYRLTNRATSAVRLSEFDRAAIEAYLSRLKQLLPILGSNILTEVSEKLSDKESATFSYEVRKCRAFGDRSATGFVIYAGSTASLSDRPGAAKHGAWTLELRSKLKENGSLVEKDGYLIFTRDVEFSSPSAAAATVAGGPAAGPKCWKDGTGKSLKEIESSEE